MIIIGSTAGFLIFFIMFRGEICPRGTTSGSVCEVDV